MRIAPVTLLLTLLLAVRADAQPVADPDPARFQSEIDAFAAWDAKNSSPTGPVLFVGSSSIRLWKTADAFTNRTVLNRGFGGAHISDVLAHFDRVVSPYAPRAIVFYCGDNDVAEGKPPEQVIQDFGQFVDRVRSTVGRIPIIWITIKPSIARWNVQDSMRSVNDAVAAVAASDPDLFIADIWTPMIATGSPPDAALLVEDGLHLSQAGYALWNGVVRQSLERAID